MTRGKFNKRGRGCGAFRGRESTHPSARNTSQFQTDEIPITEPANVSSDNVLLNATIESCSKQLPMSNQVISSNFSIYEIKEIESVINEMSTEDQMSCDFLVPMKSLQDEINQSNKTMKLTNNNNINLEEDKKADDTKITEKEKLEEWLDNLLG